MTDPNVPSNPTPPPAPAAPYAPAASGSSTNVLAIIALIGAFVFPLAGIICGHIALNQIKRTGEGGKQLALWGTILGYVFTAFWLIFVLIYVVFFVVLFGASTAVGTYGY